MIAIVVAPSSDPEKSRATRSKRINVMQYNWSRLVPCRGADPCVCTGPRRRSDAGIYRRAREDAMLVQKAARQRLKSFLVTPHDIRYQGKTNPGREAHLRWLADEVRLPISSTTGIVFQEYVNTVTESQPIGLQRLNE